MPHFSDSLHMDTCANKFCRTLDLRLHMKRLPGKKGWFCLKCYEKKKLSNT